MKILRISATFRIMRWILVLLWMGAAAAAQDTKENADFKLAISLYNDRLYDLAIEQFQQFISTYPNTQQGIEARFYLGLTQSKLNRHEEARFIFQNFALAFPNHPKAPEAWWNAAEAYAQMGNAAEAALAFERVKMFHPKSPLAPPALLKASHYFVLAGNAEHAGKTLRAVTQEYASSDIVPEAHARLARLLFDERQFDRAAAEARKSTALAPRSASAPDAFQILAQSLTQLGRFEEARTVLTDVIARYKGDSVSYNAMLELGRLQREAGDPDAALATWAGILESAGAGVTLKQAAHLEAGDVLLLRGRNPESIVHFERAGALSGPRTAEAFYKAARAAERSGNAMKAGTFALLALERDSGTVFSKPILLTAVRGSIALGHYQRAIKLAQRFEELYPDDAVMPRLLLLMADVYALKLNDVRQAQRTYEKILTDHPGDPLEDDAFYGYARSLRAAGMHQEALSVLEALRSRFPSSDFANDVRAMAFEITTFELKNKEGGLENLALLTGDVIAGGARSDLAFRLAEIYFNDLKDYANAAAQYQLAIRFGLSGERRTLAWFRLGRALELASWKGKRTRELVTKITAAYDSVSAISPGSVLARDAVTARALVLIGDASTVSEVRRLSGDLRRNAQAGGLPSAVAMELARAYQTLRSFGDARNVLEEVLRSRPDEETEAEALFRLALTGVEMGDKDTAMTLLASYLQKYAAHEHTARTLSMLAALESERGTKDRVLELCRILERDFAYSSVAESVGRLRGDVLYAAGEISGAYTRYRQVVTDIDNDVLNPRNPPLDLVLKLADCARRTGRTVEARKFYAHVLAADTGSAVRAQVLIVLAEIARLENNFEAAARYLQEASKTGSSDPARQFQSALESANLLFEAEDYSTAVSRYTEMLPRALQDSLQRFVQSRIIVCYFRLDNLNEAERRAGTFVKSFPAARAEAALFEYERGRIHLRKDETELAVRRFENVRQRYPQTPAVPEAVYWLARAHEMQNAPQRAIQLYDSLLVAFPGHSIIPRVRLSLGNVYYALEQWDTAARYYKAIVDGKDAPPELVQYATSNLIMAYKEIGLFDAALQWTREYINRYPNDPDLILKQIDIGVIYQKLGYHDQSILHLQKLLETADKELEGELRYYIGEAYFNKGEYQQAILEFLKVPYLITQRTKVDWIATSYYMAGQAYEKMSRFEQAITMYRQIIDRAGIDPAFKTAAQKEIDRVNMLVKAESK
ncbi:MAG: tetratricopeptide repeat protein [Ignavibacteriales bacterium]|nr:tetratricopeptide repeat protein [Ignavibacteriales bacterium]